MASKRTTWSHEGGQGHGHERASNEGLPDPRREPLGTPGPGHAAGPVPGRPGRGLAGPGGGGPGPRGGIRGHHPGGGDGGGPDGGPGDPARRRQARRGGLDIVQDRAAMRKVVITGIGPVTPVGIGLADFWSNLTAGRSGVSRIRNFDPSGLPVQIAGEIHDFDPTRWMTPKEARRTDRVVHFAVAAAKLAWEDAGEPSVDPARTAVV